jgi:asparaginyl-tRNA synthetase
MSAILTGSSEQLKSSGALKVLATASKGSIPVHIRSASAAEVASLTTLFDGMVLTLPDGKTSVSGSASSIMKTVASLAPASGLVGHGDAEEAEIDSWVTYGQTNIEVPVAAMKAARTKIDSAVMDSIKKDMDHTISVLNCHVMPKKYMVGDSFTVADIAIACALKDAAKLKLFDPSSNDEKTEHICRWFKTVTSDSCFDVKVNAEDEGAPAGESSTAGVSLHGAAPVVQNKLYKRNRIRIKEVLNDPTLIGKTITIAGWTRTLRKAGGKLMFIELNDGSCGTSIQCTFQAETTEGFDDAKGCGGTGSSFQLTGEVIESPAAGQAVELKVTVSKLLGAVYGGDAKGETVGGMLYPMSKKGHTLEHMRDNAHLRPRAGLHAAAMRVRHAMAYATHKFFHDHGFLYIHTPIITCADCEGAGEQFGVTTMLGSDHHKPGIELKVYKEKPVEEAKPLSKSEQKRLAKQAAKNAGKSKEESMKPEHKEVPGAVDYTDDFFSKRANLTVSGQLNVETHACALSDVYTFGPTFRAENSHTSRHLSEFWMIEPEIAFADLQDDINLAEDYLKYCVQYALEMCSEDLEFFENSPFGEVGLRARLKNVLENPFKRLTYTEGIEILQKAYESGHKFEEKPEWGMDLPSEMERYLCETVFKQPVVLTNYPKEIKAFYMKLDDDGKTVSAADILVPKIGEIIGGSQREHRKDILVQRCIEMGLDPKDLWWYIDLRKYGTVPHAGFGLGFERLILFITGLDNIRDVIPFPRWAGNAEF